MRKGLSGLREAAWTRGLSEGRRKAASQLPTAPATPVDVTFNGITWTLSHDAPRTTDAVGVPIIQAVQDLQVTQRTSPYQSGARTINGTMKNPMRGAEQGIDSDMLTYSSGAVQSFPIDVGPGDIVAGRLSDTSGTYNRRRGTGTDSYLCFVGNLPSAGAGEALFAPAAMGWSGRGTPAVRSIDVDAFIDAHTTIDGTTLPLPSAAQILGAIGQPIAFGARTDRDVENGYEAHLPLGWGGSDTNYGQYSAGMLAAATAALYADNRYTVGERRSIAEWLIHASIALTDPIIGAGPGAAFYNGGGHAQWQAALFIVAAKALGNDTILSGIETSFPNSLTEQPFVMTQPLLDRCVPHDNAGDPFTYARRTPSAISGTTITFPGRYSGGTPLDPTWLDCDGLELVRESDGASATITSVSNINLRVGAGGTWNLTIAAQPGSPFTTSDVLYLRPVVPLALGEIYWTLTGTNAFSQFNPSPQATYVALFQPSATILYLYAAQMGAASGGVLDTARDWTIQGHAQDFPSAGLPYPSPHTIAKLGSDFAIGEAIWGAEAHNLVPGAPVPNYMPSDEFAAGEEGFIYSPTTSTVYQDTGGLNPASNGQDVGFLTDGSGNGNNATEPTAKPRFLDASPAYLEFVRGVEKMNIPSLTLGSSTAVTLVMAVNIDAAQNYQRVLMPATNFGVDTGYIYCFFSGGGAYFGTRDTNTSPRADTQNFTRNVNQLVIARMDLAAGVADIEVNGAQSGANASITFPASANTFVTEPYTLYDLGGTRMYHMTLVDKWISDLTQIRQYYADEMGIALP